MYEIISKICLQVGHVEVVRSTRTVVGNSPENKGLSKTRLMEKQ